MATNKYYSKFSGTDLDKAVEYILKLKAEAGVIIIGSTPEEVVDLNNVTDIGNYVIHFYSNSYDDSQVPTLMELMVFEITDGIYCQRYDVRGETVQRLYSTVDKEFTNWAPVKNILSVEQDEVVSVGKPTLILRHYNGKASADLK